MASYPTAFLLAAVFVAVHGLPAGVTVVSTPASLGGAYPSATPQPQDVVAMRDTTPQPDGEYGTGNDDDYVERRGRSRRRSIASDCSTDASQSRSRSGRRSASSRSRSRSESSQLRSRSESCDSDASRSRSRGVRRGWRRRHWLRRHRGFHRWGGQFARKIDEDCDCGSGVEDYWSPRGPFSHRPTHPHFSGDHYGNDHYGVDHYDENNHSVDDGAYPMRGPGGHPSYSIHPVHDYPSRDGGDDEYSHGDHDNKEEYSHGGYEDEYARDDRDDNAGPARRRRGHLESYRDNSSEMAKHDVNASEHSQDIADHTGRFSMRERHADESTLNASIHNREMVDRWGQRATSRRAQVDASRDEADAKDVQFANRNGRISQSQRSGSQDTLSAGAHERTFVGPNRRAREHLTNFSQLSRNFSSESTTVAGRPFAR